MEDRILVLASRGRDAAVVAQLLEREGHPCFICTDGQSLAAEIAAGAGAALVTEESLAETDRTALDAWLSAQASWSDFPFILLATKRIGRRPADAVEVLERLGNVVVLERPIHGETLSSAVASALRGRRRQYEARKHLRELVAAEEQLRQLNSSLEGRIQQRTEELSIANNQLMQEIAERERAQAALVQSQKMDAIGQLTGGIAHDFNNLLTVIGGNLELIQRRTAEDKTATLAGHAVLATDRASKLTRQLLAFSRSQRLTLKPVNVNALIRGMGDLLDGSIGPLFEVAMVLDPSEPWAMGDANQLELAILNLAINGRDAMKEGVITISTETRVAVEPDVEGGEYVVVTVTDTGSGIPADVLEKVFDPFFTTKPLGKGTGLGLSQVYGIAQQSGGTVRIDSRVGQGTRVHIWLPATLEPSREAEAPTARMNGDAPKAAELLLIEDDPAVRRFVVESLEQMGFSVVTAAQGEEGLAKLRERRPALMIVDFAMPGMNGAAVVEQAARIAPRLPILLATGYADMEAVHRVIDPSRVLRKPFRIADLERAVKEALAQAANAG